MVISAILLLTLASRTIAERVSSKDGRILSDQSYSCTDLGDVIDVREGQENQEVLYCQCKWFNTHTNCDNNDT